MRRLKSKAHDARFTGRFRSKVLGRSEMEMLLMGACLSLFGLAATSVGFEWRRGRKPNRRGGKRNENCSKSNY